MLNSFSFIKPFLCIEKKTKYKFTGEINFHMKRINLNVNNNWNLVKIYTVYI